MPSSIPVVEIVVRTEDVVASSIEVVEVDSEYVGALELSLIEVELELATRFVRSLSV